MAAPSSERSNRLIYLDTSIWNLLCDQAADAKKFCDMLAGFDSQAVLGLNAYQEMLKTFYGARANSKHRARQLIRCLDSFVRAGVPTINTWETWLVEESHSVTGKSNGVSVFLRENEQKNLAASLSSLVDNSPPRELEARLTARKEQNISLRNSAKNTIVRQPEILADLREVKETELSSFLDKESIGVRGAHLLARYLPQVFREMGLTLPMLPDPLASALLAQPSNRASRTIVRTDIYRNWRAANSPGITFPTSVPDDSYHVVNACYCDAFVTEDRDGQATAAINAVPGIRVLIYSDRETPVAEWLVGMLEA
jgi:hypothetical protein